MGKCVQKILKHGTTKFFNCMIWQGGPGLLAPPLNPRQFMDPRFPSSNSSVYLARIANSAHPWLKGNSVLHPGNVDNFILRFVTKESELTLIHCGNLNIFRAKLNENSSAWRLTLSSVWPWVLTLVIFVWCWIWWTPVLVLSRWHHSEKFGMLW